MYINKKQQLVGHIAQKVKMTKDVLSNAAAWHDKLLVYQVGLHN